MELQNKKLRNNSLKIVQNRESLNSTSSSHYVNEWGGGDISFDNLRNQAVEKKNKFLSSELSAFCIKKNNFIVTGKQIDIRDFLKVASTTQVLAGLLRTLAIWLIRSEKHSPNEKIN